MDTIVKEFILPWKALLGFFILVVFVLGVQSVIYAVTVYEPKVVAADVSCTVKEFNSESGRVIARLTCGGHEARLSDATSIVAYLKEPQPFFCTLYENTSQCELRKK